MSCTSRAERCIRPERPTNESSWRRAEPTNHLDLEACVWLEQYLSTYNRILVIVSHSQDFMNGVCTNILHMQKKKVTTYGGNYDSYVVSRRQLEENQMKKYNWEQEQARTTLRQYVCKGVMRCMFHNQCRRVSLAALRHPAKVPSWPCCSLSGYGVVAC